MLRLLELPLAVVVLLLPRCGRRQEPGTYTRPLLSST